MVGEGVGCDLTLSCGENTFESLLSLLSLLSLSCAIVFVVLVVLDVLVFLVVLVVFVLCCCLCCPCCPVVSVAVTTKTQNDNAMSVIESPSSRCSLLIEPPLQMPVEPRLMTQLCDKSARVLSAAGQTIKEISFADWGLPFADGADPLTPGASCATTAIVPLTFPGPFFDLSLPLHLSLCV